MINKFLHFRFLCVLVVLLLLKTIIIIYFVYSRFNRIMTPHSSVVNACAALYIAATSLFACVTAFNVCCLFILKRTHSVNLMLEQLLFDEPLDENYMYLNTNHGILPKELHYMRHRRFTTELKTEKSINRPDVINTRNIVDVTNGINPISSKLFDADKAQSSSDLIANSNPRGIYEDNEDYHLSNLMESFGLRDFKILFYTFVLFNILISFHVKNKFFVICLEIVSK